MKKNKVKIINPTPEFLEVHELMGGLGEGVTDKELEEGYKQFLEDLANDN